MHVTYKISPTAIVKENHYYRDWPGRSPTVNISWFIAKAYLANLYYTASMTTRQRSARVTTSYTFTKKPMGIKCLPRCVSQS